MIVRCLFSSFLFPWTRLKYVAFGVLEDLRQGGEIFGGRWTPAHRQERFADAVEVCDRGETTSHNALQPHAYLLPKGVQSFVKYCLNIQDYLCTYARRRNLELRSAVDNERPHNPHLLQESKETGTLIGNMSEFLS